MNFIDFFGRLPVAVTSTRAVAAGMYDLVMATVLQNEAPFLPEWMEYHLLPALGFEHFYLYDDGSTDDLDHA